MKQKTKEMIRNFIFKVQGRKDKWSFIASLEKNVKIFDVGCGNHSAKFVKKISPTCKYVGIDIGDYNLSQSDKDLMDEYILVTPEEFSSEISKFSQEFDAVISSHNIEHVFDRNATLIAMLQSVKKGGKIYLSFPCEASVNFPKRYGTLNYFDDGSHQGNPPKFDDMINLIIKNDFEINFAKKRYRPWFPFLRGIIMEPRSILQKKVLSGTWALYGFETIIHATKKA